MATSSSKLRAYAAAVTQLTAALTSSTGTATLASSAQLARLHEEVLSLGPGLPKAYTSFARRQQDVLKACIQAFAALAPRVDHEWLPLLSALAVSLSTVVNGCSADDADQVSAWLQSQGGWVPRGRDDTWLAPARPPWGLATQARRLPTAAGTPLPAMHC
jgi:hypothetical protein